MTPEQKQILEHSLGIRGSRVLRDPEWPWRNHYATAPDCDGYADILALVEAGHMKQGRKIEGGLTYFHATKSGIDEALKGHEVKNVYY